MHLWTILCLVLLSPTSPVVIDVTLPENGLELGCEPDEIGYKPHPYDCRSFISCSKMGISWVQSCPRGLWYNPSRKICDYDHFHQCHDGQVAPRETEVRFPSPGPRLDSPPTFADILPTAPVVTEAPKKKPDDIIAEAVVFISNIRSDLIGLVSDRLRQEAFAAANVKEDVFSPFHSVQSILGSLGPARELSIPAQFQLEGLTSIKKQFLLDKKDTEEVIEKLPGLLDTSSVPFRPGSAIASGPITSCPFPRNNEDNNCNSRDRYRTIDGACNNLKRPLWGKSFVSLSRFLPPDYADGIEMPRVSTRGQPLPSSRLVSLMLFENKANQSPTFSVMFMTFGQFLDHDIGRTAVVKLSRNVNGTGSLVNVRCGSSGCETSGPANRACLPISIPQNDPDFSGRRCLKFVRTQETVTTTCKTVSRQQLNQITSYLDASNVYGSTLEGIRTLRESSPTRGRLRTSPSISGQLPMLPTASNNNFMAGDSRVNEQVGLTAIHTVWHRYHNILEERLKHINPHWPGETLFQESKRILTAVWQYVVYNEYLPLVVGPKVMERYGLQVGSEGFVDAYDENINADATNAFQTAAFRFGHSQIPSILQFVNPGYSQKKGIHLTDAFNHPGHLYSTNPTESSIDSLVLGMISQSSEKSDRHFSRQVTRSLFTDKPPHGLGTDLSSLNIQRGRDHGLPGYNTWRKWCGLPSAKSFDDLSDIPSDVRNRLKNVYRSVEDIDLYAGGMSESHVPGGAVGPTFACIIAQQFRNLKVGDRFWHERNDSTVGFTAGQLKEIRKMTLARVLCTSLDRVDSIQRFVLMLPRKTAFANLGSRRYMDAYSFQQLYRGDDNERRPCEFIDDLDLFKWLENRPKPKVVQKPIVKIVQEPFHQRRWRVIYPRIPVSHQVLPLVPAASS